MIHKCVTGDGSRDYRPLGDGPSVVSTGANQVGARWGDETFHHHRHTASQALSIVSGLKTKSFQSQTPTDLARLLKFDGEARGGPSTIPLQTPSRACPKRRRQDLHRLDRSGWVADSLELEPLLHELHRRRVSPYHAPESSQRPSQARVCRESNTRLARARRVADETLGAYMGSVAGPLNQEDCRKSVTSSTARNKPCLSQCQSALQAATRSTSTQPGTGIWNHDAWNWELLSSSQLVALFQPNFVL